MAIKTRDYTLTGSKGLEPDEQLLELNEPKEQYACLFFKRDLEVARKLNLNLARILRFKLHDWLDEKIWITNPEYNQMCE